MRIRSLEAFNVHKDLLSTWEAHYGPELLPVQALAVSQGGVLGGSSVVVDAPTGAGKTFVGEMAAVQAAMQGRRVIYLVPTKALAEAKFFHFQQLYEPLGIHTLIATRDRRSSDKAILRRDFHVVIGVPEKLRSLLVHSPQLASGVGCVIADELQLLGDTERGACLEVVLSELRAACPQIVGLSATLPNAEELAEWLEARPVRCDRRPVELRKGALCDGVFYYQEHNSGQEAEEEFPTTAGENGRTLLRLLAHFASAGEPTLVFVRDKRSSKQLAYRVAQTTAMVPAQRAQERLAHLEPTAMRKELWELLAAGVAFHNADMQFAERQIIEEAFAAGEIGVLCATSTLAMGVNLPARNVIIDSQRWVQDTQEGGPALVPLSCADFENMGGRAGRIQFGEAFGRALLLADSDLMRSALLERYVRSGFAPLQAALGRQHPLQQVLTLCATSNGQGLAAAYQRSFTAFRRGCEGNGKLPAELRLAAHEAQERGLVRQDDLTGAVVGTAFGKLCASSGISVEGFCWLREWAEQFEGRAPNNLETLTIAAMCPDARALNFICGAAEFRTHDYCQALIQEANEQGEDTPLLRDLLGCPRIPAAQRARSAKLALLLLRWSSLSDTEQVEQDVHLPAGRLEKLGEVVGWLMMVLTDIGRECGWPQEACLRLERMAGGIAAGLPIEGLTLRRLRDQGLGRDQLLSLIRQGIEDPSELSEADLAKLTEDIRSGLSLSSRRQQQTTADSQAPVLTIDDRSPDRVIFHGAEVSLRPSEYKLLRALAEQPGHCVSYDHIYNSIWDEGELVQTSQVHWHRHNLSKKLMATTRADEISDPIETVPRRGYRLGLTAAQVRVI